MQPSRAVCHCPDMQKKNKKKLTSAEMRPALRHRSEIFLTKLSLLCGDNLRGGESAIVMRGGEGGRG